MDRHSHFSFLGRVHQLEVTPLARYEQVRYAEKTTAEHKEKLLLAHLISDFEERKNELPEVDPVKLVKIRMEDFGYKSVDQAKPTTND